MFDAPTRHDMDNMMSLTHTLMDATLEENSEVAEQVRNLIRKTTPSFADGIKPERIGRNLLLTVILPKEVTAYRSRFIHVERPTLQDTITLALLGPPAKKIEDPRLAWDDHIKGDQVLHKEYVCHRVYGTVYEAQP